MKDKILIFLVGLLLGAVIATGSILAYNSLVSNNTQSMPGGNGQMNMQDGNTPPDMPSNTEGQN